MSHQQKISAGEKLPLSKRPAMDHRNSNRDSFISEPITPDRESFDTSFMASGIPGLPRKFTWRNKNYEVAEVLETSKSTGPCHSGSPEKYVRKHYFKVRTRTGEVMTLYCTRQPPKSSNKTRDRWILFSITKEDW